MCVFAEVLQTLRSSGGVGMCEGVRDGICLMVIHKYTQDLSSDLSDPEEQHRCGVCGV